MIRGDANAAIPPRDFNSRDSLFNYFMERLNLCPLLTNHKTYHHFMGNGVSDSSIDVILQKSSSFIISEEIKTILCSKSDSRVDSKHDIIVSAISVPFIGEVSEKLLDKPPTIPNTKHRILWSDEGIMNYRNILSQSLLNIQHNWQNPSSPVSFSVLLELTNEALASAAKNTNKLIDLSKEKPPFKVKVPPEVTAAAKFKKAAFAELKNIESTPSSTEDQLSLARTSFSDARKAHRRAWRRSQAIHEQDRDQKLSALCTKNPNDAYKHLRSVRSTSSSKISEIKVGDKVYQGKDVATGFFHNIEKLKTELDPATETCLSCKAFIFDHRLIKEICRLGDKIPPLSLDAAEKLLHSLKPSVCDHWNISAAHYINGGPVALKHFQFLVNTALENIENTTVDEMNTAHACILFKGHQKDKTLASSYRTISTCPMISKACDTYIRNLSVDDWFEARAEVQFLGPGMSHEMGALLLSEVIHYSITTSNKPVYALFLDARSAFDRTIREILIRKLYLLGTNGNRLLYFDNRLKHRKTFCEWDHTVLGPIHDKQGVEQGGVPSGDLYTVYNNEQLDNAQDSGLGVPIHHLDVASIGQADDCVLLANDVFALKSLLTLTLDYCNKYHVMLAPEKTKLVVFSSPKHKTLIEFAKLTTEIKIADTTLQFSDTAEHVGILRSSGAGNLPHILDRISAHRKSLFAVLPAGLARRHNPNIAASLKVQSSLALPVLLSGLASLNLTSAETEVLDKHYKGILRALCKLPDKTPDPVIYFMAGSLPIKAHIHRRQLSLFGMISRLPENILCHIATKILSTEPDSSKSWFISIRRLCRLYSLPSPLQLLQDPPAKISFKKLVKSKITDYWETTLRSDTLPKTSLVFFKPMFMSLSLPHPIFSSCASNSYESNKSICQATLLSGRYKTDYLARHWNKDNPEGYCILCPGQSLTDTLEHFLLVCNSLLPTRQKILEFWSDYSCKDDHLRNLLVFKLSSEHNILVQFLIDPSTDSDVIQGVQQKVINLHDVFKLTRCWCYAVHRKKLQISGKFRHL